MLGTQNEQRRAPATQKLPASMELSVGRRSEGRRNRKYTVTKKLYNLLEGDKCSGRSLNRVKEMGSASKRSGHGRPP